MDFEQTRTVADALRIGVPRDRFFFFHRLGNASVTGTMPNISDSQFSRAAPPIPLGVPQTMAYS
jgi:hypothetical protein